MKKVLTVVLLVAAFYSCKKSADTTTQSSIQPLTAGNSWTYAFATGKDSITPKRDTFTLKVLSYDSTYDGYKYKILSDTSRKYNFLYRSVGDTDFRRGLFSTIKTVTIPDLLEPYYIENASVGSKWVFPISISTVVNGIPVSIQAQNNYAIVSLSDSMKVNNTTYYNVSHISLNITGNGNATLGGGDFYYAKGYGALSYVFSVKYLGVGIYQSQTLLSSHIQ